jgi:hypothetical protein
VREMSLYYGDWSPFRREVQEQFLVVYSLQQQTFHALMIYAQFGFWIPAEILTTKKLPRVLI